MHTLTLKIENGIYENLSSKNIDISAKIKEYLLSLVNDGYPSVPKEEAKQKVSDAVNRYRSGEGAYTTLNSTHLDDMNKYIESL